MDIPEVRRRVRAAIEQARRDQTARRERTDTATRAFDELLAMRAVPAFNKIASALTGEGHRFKVFTPAGSVRLSSESSPDDFIELSLDTTEDPPLVLGRTQHGRGRRAVMSERPIRARVAPADITEDDIVEFLLSEIGVFVER
jgi:hypothetical protein